MFYSNVQDSPYEAMDYLDLSRQTTEAYCTILVTSMYCAVLYFIPICIVFTLVIWGFTISFFIIVCCVFVFVDVLLGVKLHRFLIQLSV